MTKYALMLAMLVSVVSAGTENDHKAAQETTDATTTADEVVTEEKATDEAAS
jgi:hypothetical protein